MRADDNQLETRCLRTATLNWVCFRVVGAGYQRPLDHWQDAQRLDSLPWLWLARWNGNLSKNTPQVCTKVFRSIVKPCENSSLVKCGASLKTIYFFTSNRFLDWILIRLQITSNRTNQGLLQEVPDRQRPWPHFKHGEEKGLPIAIFWVHSWLWITEIMKSPSTMSWFWRVLSGKPCFQLSISNDSKCSNSSSSREEFTKVNHHWIPGSKSRHQTSIQTSTRPWCQGTTRTKDVIMTSKVPNSLGHFDWKPGLSR